MHKLFYISSSGAKIDLDCIDSTVGTAPKLRSRNWAYTLSEYGVYNIHRGAREIEVDIYLTVAVADALRTSADLDMANGTPGLLVVDSKWSQKSYIAKSDVSKVFGGGVWATLTILLLDGAWKIAESQEFYNDEISDGDALDFPHDFKYDYGGSGTNRELVLAGVTSADVRLTIFGPCLNPSVTISQGDFSNVYSVGVSVPDGARLVIDGSTKPRSITLVGKYGELEDCFAAGVRGEGEGNGFYCFEKIKPGTSHVSWDGNFNFTVTTFREEGEPPWS